MDLIKKVMKEFASNAGKMQIHIPIKGTTLHREVIEQQKEEEQDTNATSNASSL